MQYQSQRLLRLEVSFTLKDVGRTHVNLGDNHKDRYIECQCQAQVLLGHSHDASIAAHLPQQKGNVSTREETAVGRSVEPSPLVKAGQGTVHLTDPWRCGLTPEK